mmetsp:Transcript_117986/g.367588  ORF Transcript_117986/g.367588 Transcript_117986/m.367588 type:complete len:286 (-) Transcript_117986:564-1421(-)
MHAPAARVQGGWPSLHSLRHIAPLASPVLAQLPHRGGLQVTGDDLHRPRHAALRPHPLAQDRGVLHDLLPLATPHGFGQLGSTQDAEGRCDLPHAPGGDGPAPHVLVEGHRRDHGGHPRAQRRGCGASAAVVHSHTTAGQQPLVRRALQPQHVRGCVGRQVHFHPKCRPVQPCPTAHNDAAPPDLLQRAHRQLLHGATVHYHGAPADAHGRRPLREELGQLVVLGAREERVTLLHQLLLLRPLDRPETRDVDSRRRRGRHGSRRRRLVRVAELLAHGEQDRPRPA